MIFESRIRDLASKGMRVQEIEGFCGRLMDSAVQSEDDEWIWDEGPFFPADESGGACYHAINAARAVVRKFGGYTSGFSTETNPTATIDSDGMDFAIVDNRYLVDWWGKHCAGVTEKCVYDLQSESDMREVNRWFGDPAKWSPPYEPA